VSTIAQSPYTPGGIPSQRALAVLNDFAMPGSQDENSIATTRARVSGIARGEHAPSRFVRAGEVAPTCNSPKDRSGATLRPREKK
jgi:hypothetical protein